MAPRVILTKGLPASGKSTWAKEQVRTGAGLVKRVNKDDLRAMLDADEYSPANERFVLMIRDSIIIRAIRESHHIIIDDTNLNPEHERHIRELVGPRVRFEVQDFTDVSVGECLKRNEQRGLPIKQEVIHRMAKQWKDWKEQDCAVTFAEPPQYRFDPSRVDAIVVDIDGTLAHHWNRSPFDYSKVGSDYVDPQVRDVVNRFSADHRVIVVSGRDEKCRHATMEWLDENRVRWDKLYMREHGDERDDRIIKRELYDRHIADKYNIWFVLDDRDRVVSMWRNDLGIKVLQVEYGDF